MRKRKPAKAYSEKRGYYASPEEVERIRIILRMIGSNKSVLDLGCYNGYILKKITKQGNKVTGIDASKELMRTLAIEGYTAFTHDLESKLPCKTASYDIVFAGEIIEHLVDTELFLAEIHRVLKEDGELILTTPNVAALDRRLMLLFNRNPYFEASVNFPKGCAGHLRFYNSTLLRTFLNEKGFEVLDLQTEFVPITNSLRSRLLGRLFPSLGYSLIVKCRRRT